MEVKQRWIFVFFLLYLILTFVLSKMGWKEPFIERELSTDGDRQIVGMVQG